MSAQPVDLDWGATREAERRREVKAQALARAAWAQGWHAADVPTWTHAEHLHLARIAKVNAPRAGSTTTWDLVAAKLGRFEAYAEAHPEHPNAQQPPRPSLPCPPDAPPRWPLIVAEGELQAAPCGIEEHGRPCGRAGVAWWPVAGVPLLEVPRCAGHPPGPDDWGHRVLLQNTSPLSPCHDVKPCWCHRHPGIDPTGGTDS